MPAVVARPSARRPQTILVGRCRPMPSSATDDRRPAAPRAAGAGRSEPYALRPRAPLRAEARARGDPRRLAAAGRGGAAQAGPHPLRAGRAGGRETEREELAPRARTPAALRAKTRTLRVLRRHRPGRRRRRHPHRRGRRAASDHRVAARLVARRRGVARGVELRRRQAAPGGRRRRGPLRSLARRARVRGPAPRRADERRAAGGAEPAAAQDGRAHRLPLGADQVGRPVGRRDSSRSGRASRTRRARPAPPRRRRARARGASTRLPPGTPILARAPPRSAGRPTTRAPPRSAGRAPPQSAGRAAGRAPSRPRATDRRPLPRRRRTCRATSARSGTW